MLKNILFAVGALAGVAALIFAISFFDNRRLDRLTAKAPGQITQVVLQTDPESDEMSSEVHFMYAVNGQSLSDQSTMGGDVSGRFPHGAPVVVCYDPAKPAHTEVFKLGQECPPR